MLIFSPQRRIGSTQALQHEYFQEFHDGDKENSQFSSPNVSNKKENIPVLWKWVTWSWCGVQNIIYRFQMTVVVELQTIGCELHVHAGQLWQWCSCTHGVKTKITKLKLQQGHSNCEHLTVSCVTTYVAFLSCKNTNLVHYMKSLHSVVATTLNRKCQLFTVPSVVL